MFTVFVVFWQFLAVIGSWGKFFELKNFGNELLRECVRSLGQKNPPTNFLGCECISMGYHEIAERSMMK